MGKCEKTTFILKSLNFDDDSHDADIAQPFANGYLLSATISSMFSYIGWVIVHFWFCFKMHNTLTYSEWTSKSKTVEIFCRKADSL